MSSSVVLSQVLSLGAGVTLAVHSEGPAPLAPVLAAAGVAEEVRPVVLFQSVTVYRPFGIPSVGADPMPVCCALVAGSPRELGTSPPHAAEHEGVSSGGVKENRMPVFVYRPGPPAGRRKPT